MSQDYANRQPQGFRNFIENIAIVGAGGNIGKFIAEALVDTGKHRVTAISRPESKSKIPDGVVVKTVDYGSKASLASALHGQQVLIITLPSGAPPDLESKLVNAAAAANVSFIFPSTWGYDFSNPKLSKDIVVAEDTRLSDQKDALRAEMSDLGVSSWISVCCSFWYEWSLALGPEAYGFDFEKKEVTFFGDGLTKINTSTLPQVARAVKGLLGLKILPDGETDTEPYLTQFRDGSVYVSSFRISQRDMLDSVIRVTGAKTGDWTIRYEDAKERYGSGVAEMRKGNWMGFARLLYTRLFYPDGSGDFETSKGLQNDILGLPREDLDEFTRLALKMAEEKGPLGQHWR